MLPHDVGPASVHLALGFDLRTFLIWLLVTPVQFGFGLRFYRSAYAALSHGQSNMEVC